MKMGKLVIVSVAVILLSANVSILQAEKKERSATIEVMNPEYTKPANMDDMVEINADSSVEDILKATNYYYAIHDFDKAIELDELALKKTNDRHLLAAIHFSLSSNYLEKGIEAYQRNKDDSFYQRSIQFAKKYLEVDPNGWQALGNIGTVYLNMGAWEQAVLYLSEAEKHLDQNNPSYAAIEFSRSFAEEMSKKK